MWRKVAKYRLTPTLAPPTPNAAKDGSRYFPPLMKNLGKPHPGVPQTARTKSAKLLMSGIEKRRSAAMSDKAKTNPLCYVSAVIERLPIVQPPLKSWESDFAAVQAIAFDEIERALPPMIIKQQFDENPKWTVDLLNDIFGTKTPKVISLVSPPKLEEVKVAQANTDTADGLSKKDKKKGGKDSKAKDKTKAAPGPGADVQPTQATTSAAEKPVEDNADAGWQKAMAEMGIEFAEESTSDDMSMKLHVELKQKKEDKDVDFQPAPRITEADMKNDTKSLDRKLWHKLYLIVKRKGKWGFPRVIRKEQESLMAAARRAAFGVFNEDDRAADLFFVSPCPIGYRPDESAKDFMLKAQLLHGGNLEKGRCSESIEDFAWLTPVEVAERLVGSDVTHDEYIYLVRMFADDWWEDKADAPEIGPKDDALAAKPLKQLKESEVRERVKEEMEKWKVARAKAAPILPRLASSA